MATLTQTSSREFSVKLLATPSIVGHARKLADAHLLQWQVPRSLADDVLIVVSELVTNGVNAKIGEDIRLSLYVLVDHVLIEVWDPVQETPTVRMPTPVEDGEQDDNGGRGLSQVVQGLSDYWGVHPDTNGQGKTVYALVRIAPVRDNAGHFQTTEPQSPSGR